MRASILKRLCSTSSGCNYPVRLPIHADAIWNLSSPVFHTHGWHSDGKLCRLPAPWSVPVIPSEAETAGISQQKDHRHSDLQQKEIAIHYRSRWHILQRQEETRFLIEMYLFSLFTSNTHTCVLYMSVTDLQTSFVICTRFWKIH